MVMMDVTHGWSSQHDELEFGRVWGQMDVVIDYLLTAGIFLLVAKRID